MKAEYKYKLFITINIFLKNILVINRLEMQTPENN